MHSGGRGVEAFKGGGGVEGTTGASGTCREVHLKPKQCAKHVKQLYHRSVTVVERSVGSSMPQMGGQDPALRWN